jgi:hypothetical protein
MTGDGSAVGAFKNAYGQLAFGMNSKAVVMCLPFGFCI